MRRSLSQCTAAQTASQNVEKLGVEVCTSVDSYLPVYFASIFNPAFCARSKTRMRPARGTSPSRRELLVASGPRSFGPNENRSGRQGRRRLQENQCGTLLEISGSCSRLMMMPSKPKTPPAAISPLEKSAPGLASLSSFFLVVASTSMRTRAPANIAAVVPSGR